MICFYKYIAEEVKELFKQNDNVNSRTSGYKQATMKFRLKLEEGFQPDRTEVLDHIFNDSSEDKELDGILITLQMAQQEEVVWNSKQMKARFRKSFAFLI